VEQPAHRMEAGPRPADAEGLAAVRPSVAPEKAVRLQEATVRMEV
jgi:hypothetical protein